jgi:Putative beta-barrel porin-2, OmpL-like. bbp2
VNLQHGFTNQAIPAGGAGNGTTYFGATLGATLTPELPKNDWVKNIILRPEVRWDRSLNGTTPFFGALNAPWPYFGVTGRKGSQVTIGLNAIIPFTLK